MRAKAFIDVLDRTSSQRGELAGRRFGSWNIAAAEENECDGNLIFSSHICFLPFSVHPLTRASFTYRFVLLSVLRLEGVVQMLLMVFPTVVEIPEQ